MICDIVELEYPMTTPLLYILPSWFTLNIVVDTLNNLTQRNPNFV